MDLWYLMKKRLIFHLGKIGRQVVFGLFFLATCLFPQTKQPSGSLTIARVKYQGGGDWYNDPSALPNLARMLRETVTIDICDEEARVSLLDETLFSYPILFITGHGEIVISDEEAERLRTYLLRGGFLYADDDYGMDRSFRKAMKKVFPERELVELEFSHPIYHIYFSFSHGLPKIHEHDNKPPEGYGLFDDHDRLMVFYTYETNLSDGWADPGIHHDPAEKREEALKMGVNIMIWALLN